MELVLRKPPSSPVAPLRFSPLVCAVSQLDLWIPNYKTPGVRKLWGFLALGPCLFPPEVSLLQRMPALHPGNRSGGVTGVVPGGELRMWPLRAERVGCGGLRDIMSVIPTPLGVVPL